jgi:general secretion pathway protein D
MARGQVTRILAGYGRLLLPAALAAAAMFWLVALGASGQEATVRVEVPSTAVAADSGPFTVSVVVEDVANLGAFEFDLSYDSAVLTAAGIEQGPFLGSSGRQVQCLPARTQEGLTGLTCVTLGATPDGPSGSGVLANITFEPVAPGSSPLHFTRLTLTDPPGQPLPSGAQDATVKVAGAESAATESGGEGFAWRLWGPVIGIGSLALGAAAVSAAWWVRRSRGA